MVSTTPARFVLRSALALAVGGSLLAVAPTAAHAEGRTLAEKFHDLRVCESSNNYRTNTGNGYYGAYQFAKGTWNSLGYSGYPHKAPRDKQDAAAHKLHKQQGWHPWPACARQEHLYSG